MDLVDSLSGGENSSTSEDCSSSPSSVNNSPPESGEEDSDNYSLLITAPPTNDPGLPRNPAISKEGCDESLTFKYQLQEYCKAERLKQRQIRSLLSLLRKQPFLADLDLPKDPRTLLSNMKIPGHRDTDNYLYYGVEHCLNKIAELSKNMLPGEIHLTVNVDAFPIFTSHTLTPVLISTNIQDNLVGVVSIDHHHSIRHVKLSEEEKAAANQAIVADFISDMNRLSVTKFRNKAVILKCVTLDLKALADIKNIKAHNGIHGCPRCTIVGKSVRKVMTFPWKPTSNPLRTDSSYRGRLDEHHHRKPLTCGTEQKPIGLNLKVWNAILNN